VGCVEDVDYLCRSRVALSQVGLAQGRLYVLQGKGEGGMAVPWGKMK